MRAMRITVMTALIAPMWIIAAGCGGGGGGGSSSSSSTTTTLSGSVIDGPVSGGTVIIKDSNGNTVATGVTGSDGKYTLAVPSGTSFPLNVNVSGGTDLVTGETAVGMDSLVISDSQTTANVTPITSVVFQAAVLKAGSLGKVTAEVVSSARTNTMSSFGFGIDSEDSSIDPITSPVNSGNITSFMKSAEAMAETVRRAIGTGSATMAQAFKVIGEDLVDGSMDGKKSGGALSADMPTGFSADAVVSAVTQQKALVGAEMINNGLKVTKSDGSQIASDDVKTRFSQAMNKMDASITPTSALAKMEAVPISEKQKNQLTTDIGNAKKIQETLGADSAAMTSLQTVANNLEVGKAGANKLDNSVMTMAENATRTVTEGIKKNTYSSSVVANAVSAVSSLSISTTATTSSTSTSSTPSSSTTASTSTSSATPSSTTSTSSTSIPASSEVTIRYAGTKILYGYQMTLTTQSGLTLASENSCKSVLAGVALSAVNPSTKTLNAFSPSGFSGPADLFSCTFTVGSSVTQVPQTSDYVLSGKEVLDGLATNEKAIALSDYQITVK